MDNEDSSAVLIPESITNLLLSVSNSSTLDKSLECLIELSKASEGRAALASKNVVPAVLQLCQYLSNISSRDHLKSSLKLLRNLCAGQITSQNSFIQRNGVEIVSDIIRCGTVVSDADTEVIRIGLQLLGNVSLAGNEHQMAIWHHFFPLEFITVARLRSMETCDPLCMIIYTCCEGGGDGIIDELCSNQGLPLLEEIIRTASSVGFREEWLKLLLSKICLDGSYFPPVVSMFYRVDVGTMLRFDHFVDEQAFLLSILAGILNESMNDITVSQSFALSVLEILKCAVGVLDHSTRGNSTLPTGSAPIDVLGYSLTILRDICAKDGLPGFKDNGPADVINVLVSSGLIDLLLNVLRDLEPPSTVRKAMQQSGSYQGETPQSYKFCPYKGFRRDIVAVLGNCAYHRKHVQDEIRVKNGIILLLQQCVTDDDNPFLREWGIWCVRNLLEDSVKNQKVVADLELQGSVDVPEIAGLGLRVEVDPKTRRAKLVNS